MCKNKRFLVMSIVALLSSITCFWFSFWGTLSIRTISTFNFSSQLIAGYILRKEGLVCLIFFILFVILFILSGKIKNTKKVFVMSVIVFVVLVSTLFIVSYLRTNYKKVESSDILTEKKQSVEEFDKVFQKYLLKNEYLEYEDKYVLIEIFNIPGSAYTYIECIPWDDSDLNIEYHLECLESDNVRLINKLHHEIYLRKSVGNSEQTHKDNSYVLYESTIEDDFGNDKYLNIIIEKENIIYSVEICTTQETINTLGKSRIVDDVLQNFNDQSD